MTTLGSGDLRIESILVGRIEIESVAPLGSVRPGLAFQGTVRLGEPVETNTVDGSNSHYWLESIQGELWHETGLLLGHLFSTGIRPSVRSAVGGGQGSIRLATEFDLATLERIEALRAGKPLRLRAELWPHLVSAEPSPVRCFAESLRLEVPQERWHEVLAGLDFARYEIVEIRLPETAEQGVEEVCSVLREAEKLLVAGDYDGVLAKSRFVVERLELLGAYSRGAFLEPELGDRRGKAFGGIASRLLSLSAPTHHEFGLGTTYSRAEAKAVLRIAASLTEVASAVLSVRERPEPQ